MVASQTIAPAYENQTRRGEDLASAHSTILTELLPTRPTYQDQKRSEGPHTGCGVLDDNLLFLLTRLVVLRARPGAPMTATARVFRR